MFDPIQLKPLGETPVHQLPRILAGFLWEMLQSALLALLLFFLLQSTVQNTRVEGYSMEPTLEDDQYVLVNKAVYQFSEPQRGDVIVFHYPRDPQKDFVKRIIGLPGEKVEIRNGRVYVNDRLLEEQYHLNGAHYSWGPRVVGSDEYFVLGDNRRNSNDSHNWGMLPQKNIVGKAWISLWPPARWGMVEDDSTYVGRRLLSGVGQFQQAFITVLHDFTDLLGAVAVDGQ